MLEHQNWLSENQTWVKDEPEVCARSEAITDSSIVLEASAMISVQDMTDGMTPCKSRPRLIPITRPITRKTEMICP